MNGNYDATDHMTHIVAAIKEAWRNGMKVEITKNKITVTNTVLWQHDMDHGMNPKADSVAYAEFRTKHDVDKTSKT